MNTDRAVFVYTTYPSIVEAEEAGRALVEQRLCACVNILERGEEAVMIVKTRAELSERVATAIKGMHSYSVPAIIVIPLESVDQPYLEWLMAETEAAAGQG